jgi:hypothetical protein
VRLYDACRRRRESEDVARPPERRHRAAHACRTTAADETATDETGNRTAPHSTRRTLLTPQHPTVPHTASYNPSAKSYADEGKYGWPSHLQ